MKFGYPKYKLFLDRLAEEVRALYGDSVLSCALFGSVARGVATGESDIDLLVVHRDGSNPEEKLVELILRAEKMEEHAYLVSEGLKPDVYPLFMSEKEISERPLILLDVLDHGIILFDSGFLAGKLKVFSEKLKALGAKKILLGDGSWAWDLKPDWRPGEEIEIVL